MDLFHVLIKLYSESNISLIQDQENTIKLILIFGGIFVVLISSLISVISVKRIFGNFHFIKKGIHLIPYKRLTSDSTTRFLLKRIVGIG
jgi:hypothetical protein